MKVDEHKFPYRWRIKDGYPAKGIEYNGRKVFSCFACGGGSTMGYKLAGFNVIGFNEIDNRMADCYIGNHDPKYRFIESVQEFKKRKELPKELFELDILDGSPPCSSFSMAGNRSSDWGVKKKFREGQSMQVLDTLFFDFLELAKRIRPKVIVSENVKGILHGKAKKYAIEILKTHRNIGYEVKEFILDASRMGVPQKRERVFFIGIRKDLIESLPVNRFNLFDDFPILDLVFFEKMIPYKDIEDKDDTSVKHGTKASELWGLVSMGEKFSKAHQEGYFFGNYKEHLDKPLQTIVAEPNHGGWNPNIKRLLNKKELTLGSSFPMDYDFKGNNPKYIMGMSVPPVMIAQIATRIYDQWLKNIKT